MIYICNLFRVLIFRQMSIKQLKMNNNDKKRKASILNLFYIKKNSKNKIYLVSEHTSTYTGTIHGAYMSGQTAAQKITSSLSG